MSGIVLGLTRSATYELDAGVDEAAKVPTKASEYPTIKGLGARLTGSRSQEPAATWRLESRPLAFVVVTFKQVLGKAVLFSC